MTPEELQQAKDRLAEYRRDLESASEIDQKRLNAVIKLEQQLRNIQGQRLSELEEQMLQYNSMIEESKRSIGDLNRELTEAYKAYSDARRTGATQQEQDLADYIALIEDEIEKQQEVLRLSEEQVKAQNERNDVAKNLIQTLTGVQEQQAGVLGLIQKGVNSGLSLGASMDLVGATMTNQFKRVLTPVNILASLAAKIVESTIMMVKTTDEALANFNKLTAAGGEFNNVIFQASFNTRQFGANLQDTVRIAGELQMTMASFSGLTDESKQISIELAAALDKVGLSAKDFGQTADLAMKGFGMSSEEAVAISQDLLGVSQQLQIPLSQLGSDFTSSMAELAKFGPQGIEIFEELAAMAKAAGVEMQTLLGIAKGFDTIEGAAEKTAKLNAILGSTLNTMEMLNATESERIMLIKQSVDATGQSFGAMDKFTQQAIANAAGITNMADANKLFNTSGAEFEAQLAKLTGETGNLEKATSAATSNTERFELMMQSLAGVVMPLIQVLTLLFDALLIVLDPLSRALNAISGIGDSFARATNLGQGFAGVINLSTLAVIGIGGAFAYASVQAFRYGTTVMAAFTELFPLLARFGTAIYTSVIAPLGRGIITAGKFALTMLTTVASALATAAGNALFFAASMLYDVVAGLAAVTAQGFAMMVPFLPFIAIAGVVAGLAYLIYDNWEFLMSWFTDSFVSLGEFFTNLGDSIVGMFSAIGDAFVGIINTGISGINTMINALNTISFRIPDFVPFIGGKQFGIDIPLIPFLEDGGMIQQEGAAYLHQGEKVLPAAQVQQLDNTVETAVNLIGSSPMAMAFEDGSGDVITAIKENTAAIKALAASVSGTTTEGNQTIVLELNERQLGKAVTDVLNKKNQLTLA